jgi:ribonuclease VapC
VIAVDTSALVAIATDEPAAMRLLERLDREDASAISAATLAEILVVSRLRGFVDRTAEIIESLNPEVVPVDGGVAKAVSLACARWGKDIHPAPLNLGDCFAYVLARSRQIPLLYVGVDFARTDVIPAL